MKAIEVNEFISGAQEMIKLKMMSKPVPNPVKKELLIKVQACSISSGDLVMISGRIIFMYPDSLPFVPGIDVAGTVVDPN